MNMDNKNNERMPEGFDEPADIDLAWMDVSSALRTLKSADEREAGLYRELIEATSVALAAIEAALKPSQSTGNVPF
jgi:hypothetical protein